MKKTTILATLAAGVVTASAGVQPAAPAPVCVRPADPCAGPISYNNAELLYAYTDFDADIDHGNGGIFRMEYSAWDNFYLAGGASYHESDGVDMWSLSGGVGAYMALSENVHLVGEVGVLWSSWDGADEWVVDNSGSSGGSGGYWDDNEDDEFGWYVRPHLRAKFGCFEAHVGAIYTDAGGDIQDDWAGFVNLYYQVATSWDLTAGVTFDDDATMITGGARYRY